MVLLPLTEFNEQDWYTAYELIFDPELNSVMGTNPEIYVTNKPPISMFYYNCRKGIEEGKLMGWLIIEGEDAIGYVIMDRRNGEWELGIGIKDPEQRGKGIGPRAVIHACRWAFEEAGARWVTAFTQGQDLNVAKMIERFGFERLYHIWVMNRAMWNETKWARRGND